MYLHEHGSIKPSSIHTIESRVRAIISISVAESTYLHSILV